jgi:hypothetical protein
MGLESATYIDELVNTNPLAADNVSQGDNHLRLIKAVLQSSFPSVDMAVNAIHASSSAPAVAITAGLVWFDTSANLLKIRNEANDAWVTLAVSPVTSNSVDINAGTVDGAIVGGSSAAAGTFTTLTANTSLTMAEDATIIFEGATDDAYETTLTVVDPTADRTVSIPNATDTLVGKATTDTLTNKSIDLGTNTLTGSLAEFNSALQSESFVSLTGSETLTNKTLTTPTLTTPVINTGASLKNGSSSAGYADFYEDSDNGTNYVRLIGPASTATVTVTLPAAADTLVGKATTDTFTNKSIDLGTNTLTGSLAEFNSALQSESFVSLTGSETLTNKTLTTPTLTTPIANAGVQLKNGASSAGFLEFFEDSDNGTNKVTLIGPASTADVTVTLPAATDTLVGKATTDTLTNKSLDLGTNTLTGSLAEFNTALQSESFVSLTGSETLTNKTLTSPAVNTGTLTTPVFSGAMTGTIDTFRSTGIDDNADALAMTIDSSENVGIGVVSPKTKLTVEGALTLKEQSAADSDTAAYGQLWVKDATPCQLYFTDDAGTDVQLVADGANVGSINDLTDALVENNSIWLGNDPSSTTDTAEYNIGLGTTALDATTTGDKNVALGYDAGTALTTSIKNTLVGYMAGAAITTGVGENVLVGHRAGIAITTGASNIAIGDNALTAQTTVSQNVAVGDNAMYANTSGSSNAALGNSVLSANTTGAGNTGLGFNALLANTTGSSNTAVGASALDAATTASQNVAVGNLAMSAVTTGSNNVAIGHEALTVHTAGTQNVAIGQGALKTNQTASNNVAIGALSLTTSTGSYNTAVGHSALEANTSAGNNVAVGYQSLEANTTGADNTAVGKDALALTTTGGQNTAVGSLALDANTTASNETAVGYNAMTANTTGNANTGIGAYALAANTTAGNNTALGVLALTAATTGGDNTGIGKNALAANTTGATNTAIGYQALDANTTASDIVAIGKEALSTNTTGPNNTAVGTAALRDNVTADGNTAVGFNALLLNTGAYNTAVGNIALDANTSGTMNTAVGNAALSANTTASQNVAIGKGALSANTTADGNTAVGYLAGDSLTTGSNNSYLGNDADATAVDVSNEFTLGNSNVDNLRCNDTSISSLSDERDKAEVSNLPSVAGLDFINSLRPITYYWDRREWYEDGESDGSKINHNYDSQVPNSGQRMGFIAQEVKESLSGMKYMEDSKMVGGTEEKLEFAPAQLVTSLVKAIQQLSEEVESLKAQLEG